MAEHTDKDLDAAILAIVRDARTRFMEVHNRHPTFGEERRMYDDALARAKAERRKAASAYRQRRDGQSS